jgi:hypothetical protein
MTEQIPEVIPKVVYVQWYGDQDPECLTKTELQRHPSLDEVSWCWEQIFPYDIEYMRMDKYDELRKERDSLQAKCDGLVATMQAVADKMRKCDYVQARSDLLSVLAKAQEG